MVYAHSVPDAPQSEWELLPDHLSAVADRASQNAQAFGAGELAAITGWLHDLGKIKPGFQAKLRGEASDTPHSGEGARYAVETFPGALGKMMGFAIAGHHAGLANGVRRSDYRPATPLQQRLDAAENIALPGWLNLPALKIPQTLMSKAATRPFPLQFFSRMLFSALVDADFIETERFYAPDAPRGHAARLDDLRAALAGHLAGFGPPVTQINKIRARVLDHAGQMAAAAPGFFSLNVPTGGGKTLTSLRFAMDHAAEHDLRRVIHVAPFTAIIEQTADVFRRALGDDDAVLEHHSSFDMDRSLPEDQAEQVWSIRKRPRAKGWLHSRKARRPRSGRNRLGERRLAALV